MRALIQRVTEAKVEVAGETVGSIGSGLCVLVGVTHDDTVGTAQRMASKVWNLRVFAAADAVDGSGMDRSIAETGGEILVVSQFTLYGDTRKGRRPSWSNAAPPPVAEPLCETFVAALRELGATVATGVFGADMAVSLVNDGPVSLMLELPTAP